MGSLPRNSGIIPNFLRSSVVAWPSRFGSSSYLPLSWAPKPMVLDLFSLSFTIFSKSGKAPPQIKRILLVSTVVIGVRAFFWLEPTGTSTWLPSRSFKSSCCTDSPLTSRLVVFFFLAILSISSIKIIPFSALSTSLSAAARSLEITLSMSSPM